MGRGDESEDRCQSEVMGGKKGADIWWYCSGSAGQVSAPAPIGILKASGPCETDGTDPAGPALPSKPDPAHTVNTVAAGQLSSKHFKDASVPQTA